MRAPVALVLTILATLPVSAPAQTANVLLPTDSVEWLMAEAPFQLLDLRGSRAEGDRTSRATMEFADGTLINAKWAPAPRGGETFNNVPRFEVAAYEVQKLFLAPDDYVVPPTVIRPFGVARIQHLDPDTRPVPTFDDLDAVLVVLQYWLFSVSPEDVWDEDRFESDPAYARHLGNFNILTYLIRHQDENEGNYLISTSGPPRIYSVDNGVAFSSRPSDRGRRWSRLRVDRLPADAVDRLRALEEEDLTRALAVLAEFRVQPDGSLHRAPAGPPLNPDRGVRKDDGVVQIGLTRREIRQIWIRVGRILEDVDDGDIETFGPAAGTGT